MRTVRVKTGTYTTHLTYIGTVMNKLSVKENLLLKISNSKGCKTIKTDRSLKREFYNYPGYIFYYQKIDTQ